MKELAISDIVIDDLQPRAATDEATVAGYAEDIEAGGTFPPVVVFHDGRDYFLADGFHRLLAWKRAEYTHIWADVQSGGRDEAAWFGAGANIENGLRRTNADKRRAVERALHLKPDLSDRAIAKHCGVNDKTVASERAKNNCGSSAVERKSNNDKGESSNPWSKIPPRRVGLDGKTRGTRAAPSQRAPEPVLVDEIGRPVPEEIAGYWDRADEVSVLMKDLSRMRGIMKRGMEDKDPFWEGVALSRIMADLGNARNFLAEAVPYAVCPGCNGKLRKTCRLCHKKGFVSKHQWDRLIPEETKAAILKGIK